MRGLAALATLWTAEAAWGQRAQFPSEVAPEGSYLDEPPPATFDGTIQEWDPYADPNAQPPAMLQQDPYGYPQQPPGYPQTGAPAMGERLLQEIKFEHTWLAGDEGDDFDVHTLELNGTFAFPFYYNAAPLLITPGFAVNYLEGPSPSSGGPDLPPRVYDAYLDVGWRPQLTPWFSADLGVRPGVHSDFDEFTSDAFRIQGRALGIFTVNPQVQIVAGILYLDRRDIKLLPAGGVIWTPNEDSRLEILFPRPKLAQRVTNIGNTEWWVYLAAEYGGGSWAVERKAGDDAFDYNDYRVMVGLEWMNFSGWHGYIEAGYVFERELAEFESHRPDFDLDDTFMLRSALAY